MQLVARPAPIVLVKVWDGDRQFVPVREQLPVQLLKETAHWGAGINTVSQASEIHATLTQLFYQRNKMPHTTPQPLQLPDNQSVTFR